MGAFLRGPDFGGAPCNVNKPFNPFRQLDSIYDANLIQCSGRLPLALQYATGAVGIDDWVYWLPHF